MVKRNFTAELKQVILEQYSPRDRAHSFAALARLFTVKGGKGTVERWHQQWNGTVESLKQKKRSGRPSLLKKEERRRHILIPIQRRDRSHTPILYPELLGRVIVNSGRKLSLRTLQRYGKKDEGIKYKRTMATTVNEC